MKKKNVKIRLILDCDLPTIKFHIDTITTETKAIAILKAHKRMINNITGEVGGYTKKTLTAKTEIIK